MNLKNHITLVGNISSDAQITNFDNGNKVARFSISAEKNYRANNGKVYTDKEWHRLFAWGSMAQFIENYAQKGKKVAVHGKLVNRTFLSPEGKTKQITEVEVRHIMGL